MMLRRLFEIELRLFTEELERMKKEGREHCSDAVVIRMQRDRLETLLDSMPAPYSIPVFTVTIPDGAKSPSAIYEEATVSSLGDNVIRFPNKRRISRLKSDMIGHLGVNVDEFGWEVYDEA